MGNNTNSKDTEIAECLRWECQEKRNTHTHKKWFRFVDIYKESFDRTQIVIEWCVIALNRGWLSSTKLVYNKLMLLHVFVVSFFFIFYCVLLIYPYTRHNRVHGIKWILWLEKKRCTKIRDDEKAKTKKKQRNEPD